MLALATHTSPSPGPASIDELARQAQHGERADFDVLAARVRGPLSRFLRSRVHGDVDDVVQETLVRAYQHLEDYDPARSFETWLFTIGKRLAINYNKKSQRQRTLDGQAADAAPTTSQAPAVGDGRIWRLAENALSAEQYRALYLRYAEDLGVKDIARELGRTVVSTKVLLFRARKKLLKEVDQP